MNTTTTTPPLDPLDMLARQAESSAASEAAAVPGFDAPPPPITNQQAMAGAIAAGREAFCFFTKLESPRRVLDDRQVTQLAELADPVLTKYGINLGQYIGDFGPELALAAGLLGVVLELRQAVTSELKAKAKTEPLETAAAEAFTSAADGQ